MRAMLTALLPVSALLVGAVLLLGGVGILNTLLSLRGGLEGFSTSVIGLITACYFAGYLVGTWIVPRIIARVGHVRGFAFFGGIAATVSLLHLLFISPWVWALLRVVFGVAMIGLYSILEGWLSVAAVREQRGRVFSAYMFLNFMALAAAQALFLVAPISGFTLFVLASILISLAQSPVVLTRLPQPLISGPSLYPVRALLAIAPLGAVGAALSGVATAAVWGLVPLMVQQQGKPVAAVAQVMITIILAGALAQIPVGHMSDRFDRRYVVFGLTLLAALSGLALGLLLQGSAALVWLLPALAGLGAAGFCVYPVCVSLTNDFLRPDEIVSAASTLLMLHGMGAVAGPLLGGALMQALGPPGLALHFLLTWGLLALYAAWRCFVAARPLRQRRDGIFSMLRTSPVVLDLLEDDLT